MFWVPHSSNMTTVTKYIIFAILFSKMAANYAKMYSFRDISAHNSAIDFILISVSIKVYTTDDWTNVRCSLIHYDYVSIIHEPVP